MINLNMTTTFLITLWTLSIILYFVGPWIVFATERNQEAGVEKLNFLFVTNTHMTSSCLGCIAAMFCYGMKLKLLYILIIAVIFLVSFIINRIIMKVRKEILSDGEVVLYPIDDEGNRKENLTEEEKQQTAKATEVATEDFKEFIVEQIDVSDRKSINCIIFMITFVAVWFLLSYKF